MTRGSLELLMSAPTVADALERAGLLAGMRAAEQALRVAVAEERAAWASTRESEASLAEVEARLEIASRAIRSQGQEMSTAWHELVAPATERIRMAKTSSDRLAAIATLAGHLSFGAQLPWADDEAFAGFVDDPGSSVVFMGLHPTEIKPSRERLAELGPTVDAPVGADATAATLQATAHHETLAVDPYAGLHVSIERRGGLYRHHGVLLGGGRVAHFGGEPLTSSEACIRIDSVDAFIGSSDPSTLRRHAPERVDRPPVAVYVPNLVALRAASMVAADGYDLFERNCEHFAAWSHLGAMISGQVDALWSARQIASARRSEGVTQRVPGVGRVDPKALITTFIAAWTMRVAAFPLAPPPADAPAREEELYDLGRIRWSRDQDDFVWWLPLWHHDDPRSDEARPDGPTDRPFAVGADPTAATWHAARPAVGLSPDWHVAVLGAPSGDVFLLDQEGTWRQPNADVGEIIIERSRPMEELHRVLARRADVFEVAPDDPGNEGPTSGELTP